MLPASPLPHSVPPTLTRLAEVVHAGAAEAAPLIVAVANLPDGELELATQLLPAGTGHPADPLVGMLADRRWSAVGIVAGGRLRAMPGPPPEPVVAPGRVYVTYLTDRTGAAASVFGPADGELTATSEPPIGWVPDVLARVLGLATPAPQHTAASWIDALWLDALAADVFRHPGRRWSWSRVAARHPLAVEDRAPTPRALSEMTAEAARIHPWCTIRTEWVDHLAPKRPQVSTELGSTIALSDWFDDGSFSRWVMRDLPPNELLLPDLLAVLPAGVGDCLTTALGEP
ncbi:MAG: hypothetical protein JWM89_3889 [Acidimicrobiales bacterium]|nr:hypothetical protein [Acidimicrobiales bacterium]